MRQVVERQNNRRRQWLFEPIVQESTKEVDLTKPIWLPNNPDPQGLRSKERKND